MNWYYMRGQDRMGPVDEVQFQVLLASQQVTAETFVWRQGMGRWQRWGELEPAAPPAGTGPDPGASRPTGVCAECGQTFDVSEMIFYKGSHVCGLCKPIFFQRIKEGAALPHQLVYGGFGRRFVAKLVDGIILGVAGLSVAMMTGWSMFDPSNLIAYFTGSGINYVIGLAYNVFFLGRFGATPGKMLLGLKVVRPDGDSISYLRALGRVFAEYLSMIILYIGYLMVLFDEERRSLHDRICDTRVILK
ncbi:MAG: RDD family protein [Candidatus Hydrogenedentes bacterium]|nr:RDD family protein [Candidatus Hydrogenedentota bacterium]